MLYSVTVRFIADPMQYEEAPLASLRGEAAHEGWCIRIDDGVLSARVGEPENPYVSTRITWTHDEHTVEWRVVDDRHELWLDGVCTKETMAPFSLGDADVIRLGVDPEMPGRTYTGVLDVEVNRD